MVFDLTEIDEIGNSIQADIVRVMEEKFPSEYPDCLINLYNLTKAIHIANVYALQTMLLERHNIVCRTEEDVYFALKRLPRGA